jgi:uncharacterized membrane protein YoaK (UPF0700 family)
MAGPGLDGNRSGQPHSPTRAEPGSDIIGFLGLNGLFTAHITGNIVVLAALIVAGDPTIFSYMLSIAVMFLTRLLAGTLEQARVSTL